MFRRDRPEAGVENQSSSAIRDEMHVAAFLKMLFSLQSGAKGCTSVILHNQLPYNFKFL